MDRRSFIRHPLSYPFHLKVLHVDGSVKDEHHGSCENVSHGGLQFMRDRPLDEGSEVELDLKVEDRTFRLNGRVVRCERADSRYSIALSFHKPSELLKARMMEQCVRIEMLKQRMERRFNCSYDFASVAREWIRRYSAGFAKEYGR